MSARESVDPNSSLWMWLAYDLRFYREKHGLSLAQLGKIIGAARSTVSNYEAGRRRIDDRQAKILDREWDTGGHFARLLTFAKLNHDPDWFGQHMGYESRATRLKIYEALLVPGLLQTREYATALLNAGAAKDVEAVLEARMARQKVLTRSEPPLVWVLLDEGVLDRPVGGPEVMRAQLANLLDAAELPHVVLRVVPRAAGVHVGLDGSFKIMSVERADVAYTEATGGGRLILDTTEVALFEVRYDRIGADALSRDSSRSLIRTVMETMR